MYSSINSPMLQVTYTSIFQGEKGKFNDESKILRETILHF